MVLGTEYGLAWERAQKFAPALILFDEIDSIAPSRSAESAQHQVSTVAQLLVLLDGIEQRGQIFVLATTNRPEQVDPALRRPGRFDQVVWMGLPDERGPPEYCLPLWLTTSAPWTSLLSRLRYQPRLLRRAPIPIWISVFKRFRQET